MVDFHRVDMIGQQAGFVMAHAYCSVILYFSLVILRFKKPPPVCNSEMHFEGVQQLGIESEIQLRQPHCHAAADADEYSRHGRWSIDGRC